MMGRRSRNRKGSPFRRDNLLRKDIEMWSFDSPLAGQSARYYS